MSNDEFRAPAGWYPDPLGHPQLRWWNSYGWTEQVSAPPEPLVVQQAPRYAWAEAEPQVIPVQTHTTHAPTPPRQPVSTTLHEIEGPRAQNRVEEPSTYEFTPAAAAAVVAAPAAPIAMASPAAAPAARAMPAAIASPAPAAPVAQTPPLPPYWDEDDMSRPTPSVRAEDLKFWSGSSPAEIRRLARERAARENQA